MKKSDDEGIAEIEERLELVTLDREMAEEKAEILQVMRLVLFKSIEYFFLNIYFLIFAYFMLLDVVIIGVFRLNFSFFSLQAELEAQKEKVAELEIELEILRSEMERQADVTENQVTGVLLFFLVFF